MKKQKKYLILFLFVFIKTLNLSAQWIQQEIPSFSFEPKDLKFANPSTGWCVGKTTYAAYYRVYKTISGGINWNYQVVPTNSNLYSLELINEYNIFSAGDTGVIIKTSSGGTYWQLLNPPLISNLSYVWDISFINSLTGWISVNISTSQHKTYKTTNGGINWTGLSNTGFDKIKFLNGNTGFGLNSSGIYNTSDGGSNWQIQLHDSLITEFYFLNENTGWCFSSPSLFNSNIKGKGYKTTNAGINWVTLYSNDTIPGGPNYIKFFNVNTGYAVDIDKSPSGIVKTTNSGTSWFNPSNYRLNPIIMYFVNAYTGWINFRGHWDPIYLYKTTTGPGNLFNPFSVPIQKNQNINQLNDLMYSDGSLVRYTIQNGYVRNGLEWPRGSGKYLICSGGINIGCYINGQLRIAQSRYDENFSPGMFDNNGNLIGYNLLDYGFYQIKKGDGPGVPDWDNWPGSQGAPTHNGQPLLLGDQTSFITLTDAKRYRDTISTTNTPPLKAEVKWLTYSYDVNNANKNIIYMKFDIINKSGQSWDSTFITFFVDPDIGNAHDDKEGCDSILNLAYVYNATNYDTSYGQNPPAVGFKLLDGPKGTRLSSIVPYYHGNYYPDPCFTGPYSSTQIYNYMNGNNYCGNPYLLNGVPRKFVFNGDPETNTGWLMNFQFDVRFSMSIGPLYLSNNQSTSITIAIIAAKGTSNLNSVTRLKQIAASLPIPVININNEVPDKFTLYQNYPNPFNPVTNIRFDIPRSSQVKLIIYDALGREVAVLVNEKLGAGSYETEWNGSGYPSGVYFYKVESDEFIEVRKMVMIK